MDAIIGFFVGIGNTIVSVVGFLVGIVEDLVYLVKATAWALAQLPGFFAWIPAQVWAILAVIFAVVVLYKLMGREG